MTDFADRSGPNTPGPHSGHGLGPVWARTRGTNSGRNGVRGPHPRRTPEAHTRAAHSHRDPVTQRLRSKKCRLHSVLELRATTGCMVACEHSRNMCPECVPRVRPPSASIEYMPRERAPNACPAGVHATSGCRERMPRVHTDVVPPPNPTPHHDTPLTHSPHMTMAICGMPTRTLPKSPCTSEYTQASVTCLAQGDGQEMILTSVVRR